MTAYSLRARMMILILTPTLLIGLLLTSFLIVHRYNQLQEQVIARGSSIIEPLAVASEHGMTFGNPQSAQSVVKLLQERHAKIVSSIAIFNTQNQLVIASPSGYNTTHLQLEEGVKIPSKLTLSQQDGLLILRTPIFAETHEIQTKNSLALPKITVGYIAIELDLHTVQLQRYKEVFICLFLLLICLSITILFTYRLMRDVTVPIDNMVEAVDRIRQGQLDSRIEGQMLGELNRLKNGINAMAVSLLDYHEEMQQHIAQATTDLRATLEQMENQNIELELAKKHAQEATRIKSKFLANISHELRTPLNGVIGFTRQMLKTPLTPTQTDYLQTIERSANNLLSIINDVLDFSKLEAGKLLLESIPFSLRETIDEVTILLAYSAHEKGIELTLDLPGEIPEFLIGDPLRLQQILTNLLGNAIKFTEQGSINICVSVRDLNEQEVDLEIQVHDTGIGISEQQQSKLFQAFRQADASISRNHGGTGLGLVISQKLVKEMGGNINFYSQLNKGSTFWFDIRVGINTELQQKSRRFHSIPSLKGQSLLYIEDNLAAVQATLPMLKQTELAIVHCTQLHQAPKNHFDILLASVPASVNSDNMYPDHEETKTMQTIAERVILAVPTHILLNAESLQKQGVESCLSKPLSQARLFQALLPSQSSIKPDPSTKLSIHQRLPIQVMAVDDNPANLKLIGALLEEMVEETILCSSAEEAIQVAQQHAPQIILMDIQMPKMDGIQAAARIHQIPQHTNTPIIAVTAHAARGERERLLKEGLDDYLTKPIDEKMLAKVLSRYFSLPLKKSNPTTTTLTTDEDTLNWDLALKRAANKEELARELLSMLIAMLPEVTNRVENILNGSPDDTIVDLIHKLHGSCSYSGAPNLKRICSYLEQQLRQNKDPKDLQPEWLELLDEIENIQRQSKTVIT